MLRIDYDQLLEAIGPLDEASTLTYDKLFKKSDPKRIFRAGQVRGPPLEITHRPARLPRPREASPR